MDTLTQTTRILNLLKASPNGVPNYRFSRMGILCYSKRIQELRADGHVILAERQFVNGRATGVWKYRLNDEPKPGLLSHFKKVKSK